MKKNYTPEKPFFKKRRRKRGRPPKYKNPVGRPKSFADPVEFHVTFERRVVSYVDALVVKLKGEGVKTTRSEIVRICVEKMINLESN